MDRKDIFRVCHLDARHRTLVITLQTVRNVAIVVADQDSEEKGDTEASDLHFFDAQVFDLTLDVFMIAIIIQSS